MKIAVAQARPAVLDVDRSVERAIGWIERAGRDGVELLAFGESFIGGYPVWVDWPGWAEFGHAGNAALFARQGRGSLRLASPAMTALSEACARATVAVAIGANLLAPSGKSIHNAVLMFDRDGQLRQVRRKLVPTHGERLCWAPAPDADGAALESVELAGERVGTLMCWEHWMPRAREALHRSGEIIHVAAWPHCSDLHQLASRHYAFEGACFVLQAALVMSPADLPDLGIPVPNGFAGLAGGSAIIRPDSKYVVEPVWGEERLIVAEVDSEVARAAAFRLDTGGHYDRPDLFV